MNGWTGSPAAMPAAAHPVSILLIGPDPATAATVMASIASHASGPCRVEKVETVSRAIGALAVCAADVVLFHPTLLDNADDALDQARLAAPEALMLPLDETRLEQDGWLPAILRFIARRKAAESALQAAEEALFEKAERARVTLESIGDAVLVTDTLGHVTYLNPVAETLTGWLSDEAVGQPLATVFRIVDGVTGESVMNPAVTAMNEDRTIGLVANCVLFQRDGDSIGIEDSAAPIHDRNGRVAGAVIIFREVGLSRSVTRKMAYLAHHDCLTGLPNRVLLRERLSLALGGARRHGKQVALLFIDLDYFKRINDSLGHAMGDQVLRAIADRLSCCVRETDTVCRFGGDEFVILLGEIDSPDDAAQIAKKLLGAVTMPVRVGGHTLQVSASVGISIHPDHGGDPETIIQQADMAMYQTKSDGRDGYRFFHAEMKRELVVRRSDNQVKSVR
ncbi:MAG: diguanylate cyclase [Ectothiorhodospiraceae bacterium]|nr:diguanylate cyclase [Ectothiorhodospiraceae bacterium]